MVRGCSKFSAHPCPHPYWLGCLVIAFGLLPVGLSCRSPGPAAPMPASAEGWQVYLAHCAACHGNRGEGDGPAAIALEVRPRDFRNEPFRYISTLDGTPTEQDLKQTIRSGRHFGAMPARPSLTDSEVNILADYVREINRLGWVESLTQEFADDEDMTPEDVEEIALEKVTPGKPIPILWRPPGFRSDTEVGRKLYMASCASCHGPTGRGDGLDKPKDELGKPIAVRDLTSGAFRGGVEAPEIFKRIRCGVPGTPMPAQEGLSDGEVWQLVYYTRFLAGWR